MTQPRAYSQTTTFTDHSTVAPSDPHSGANLDTEFVELKQNLDDVNTNLALLQRDDGKLLNTAVHKDSFDQDALAFIGATGSGFTPRGTWVTATAYVSGDLVTNNAATYLTVSTSHTSGSTFAGDLATHWQLIANSAIETTSASIDMHNGDGSNKVFTTTYTYTAVGDVQVFVNGALQATNLYTVTNTGGNNITFTAASSAPSTGTNNVIIWGATVVAEAAKAGALTYSATANNHKTTADRFANLVTGSVTDAESGATAQGFSSKAYAIGGTGVTGVSTQGSAKDWAVGAGGVMATQPDAAEYSAKEYATGTTAPLGSSKSWATKDTSAVASSLFSAKEYASGSSATGGTAKEWATNAGSAEVDSGAGYSSKAYAQDTGNDIGSSKDWAILGTQVSSTDYSSKQYAVGTPPDGSAKEWAKTTGAVVADSEYSAKEYAIGTTVAVGSSKDWAVLATTPSGTSTDASSKEWATGTSTHKNDGSAKSWATVTGAVVTGSEYSAKEYALGTTVAAGSAKDWAILAEDSVVDGGSGYSALHHSAKSADFATAASASEVAAKNSANAIASTFDSFDDTYLGTMSNTSAQGTNPTTNGTWAKNSSSITVASGANIKIGQLVTGTGMPTGANVLSISGSGSSETAVISENMVAAGTTVALTFTGYGVYGTYNGTKDGPTTDNDNGALANGMLYFNSTDNNMMVYKTTGAAWIAATSSGGVSLVMHKAVASGTPTSFVATDFTPTLSYEVDNIVVFLNGVRLDATDYTATTGTTITGLVALANLDEMTILAFKTFEVADAVSAASGGTFSGAVTFGAGLVANTADINGGTIDGATITGNIVGNASGTAATVTGSTQAAITTTANLVSVGALNVGSITSGFTSIDVGAGAITTTGALTGGTATVTGLITANGGLETDTNSKIKQKGAFMQSSTHQSWVMGG
jgi:hypothetical protein